MIRSIINAWATLDPTAVPNIRVVRIQVRENFELRRRPPPGLHQHLDKDILRILGHRINQHIRSPYPRDFLNPVTGYILLQCLNVERH